MSLSNWITLGVGTYAAIVATVALVWNILRERRKVKVKVRYAYGVGAFEGQQMVAIEVINNGLRSINIQEIGFIRSDRRNLINPSAQHKFGWLKGGDGTSFYVPKDEIDYIREQAKEEKVRIVSAYVRDSTNTYHKGKIRKNANWFNR